MKSTARNNTRQQQGTATTDNTVSKHSFIPKAMQKAIRHHQGGRLAQAALIYREILRADPQHADALHLLGLIFHQQGESADAVALICQAITIQPLDPGYHFNLGTLYQDLGRLDEAVKCFRQSLALQPSDIEAHIALGTALRAQGDFGGAIASYQQAQSIQPNRADVYANMGNASLAMGDRDQAAACFRKVLALEPANGTARHLIAIISGGQPETAPADYVEKIFDDYAATFDKALVDKLKYKEPEMLIALLKDLKSIKPDGWDVLDLGCGTGLSGAAIHPYARKLVGVDLSANMLARAQAKNIYQRLEKSELLSMMKQENTASYDVLVAADVFIYVGRLDEVVKEGARLLRPAGLFAFSVEAMESLPESSNSSDDKGFLLNPATGRYAHSADYIHSLAKNYHFSIAKLTSGPTRLEKGKPVVGWHVVFGK